MPITFMEIICTTCGDTGEIVVYLDEEGNEVIQKCPECQGEDYED